MVINPNLDTSRRRRNVITRPVRGPDEYAFDVPYGARAHRGEYDDVLPYGARPYTPVGDPLLDTYNQFGKAHTRGAADQLLRFQRKQQERANFLNSVRINNGLAAKGRADYAQAAPVANNQTAVAARIAGMNRDRALAAEYGVGAPQAPYAVMPGGGGNGDIAKQTKAFSALVDGGMDTGAAEQITGSRPPAPPMPVTDTKSLAAAHGLVIDDKMTSAFAPSTKTKADIGIVPGGLNMLPYGAKVPQPDLAVPMMPGAPGQIYESNPILGVGRTQMFRDGGGRTVFNDGTTVSTDPNGRQLGVARGERPQTMLMPANAVYGVQRGPYDPNMPMPANAAQRGPYDLSAGGDGMQWLDRRYSGYDLILPTNQSVPPAQPQPPVMPMQPQPTTQQGLTTQPAMSPGISDQSRAAIGSNWTGMFGDQFTNGMPSLAPDSYFKTPSPQAFSLSPNFSPSDLMYAKRGKVPVRGTGFNRQHGPVIEYEDGTTYRAHDGRRVE